MQKPRIGMFVHGLDLNADDWGKRAMFGEPPLKLGRVGRAVQLLRDEYPAAELMLFGSGASEKGGLKEGEYTIKYLVENFFQLLEFQAFKRTTARELISLKQTVAAISRPELTSVNTLTELRAALPFFLKLDITRIILVSDYPHISRCLAHAGQVIEEQGLEGKVKIIAEHSGYRDDRQPLSGVKVFEPERFPEDGIQLGDMAAKLFKVKKGNRAAFEADYDALVAKYSAS